MAVSTVFLLCRKPLKCSTCSFSHIKIFVLISVLLTVGSVWNIVSLWKFHLWFPLVLTFIMIMLRPLRRQLVAMGMWAPNWLHHPESSSNCSLMVSALQFHTSMGAMFNYEIWVPAKEKAKSAFSQHNDNVVLAYHGNQLSCFILICPSVKLVQTSGRFVSFLS